MTITDDDFFTGFSAPSGPDPECQALKREIMNIVLWNEHQSPRSQQIAIGPSELGVICDRRIAYKLANIPAINDLSDPWPAVVGTAVHDWLEKAVNNYQAHNGDLGWLTEMRVYPDPLVKGRSDVYNHQKQLILDYKTAGTQVMRKVKKGEIPQAYIKQIHIYGLGHERAGRPVKEVALAFFPRSGWLDDMVIWKAPYDESIAKEALNRMYRIGYQLIDLDIENNPHRFEQIDATPGDDCTWCAWFSRSAEQDAAASQFGCPGR